MINFVQQSQESIVVTSTSVVLGTPVGTTTGSVETPSVLILWSASAGTVTLPAINTTLPTQLGQNYVPGSQQLKIEIKSLTGQTISVSANTADSFFGGDVSNIIISSTGAHQTFLGTLGTNGAGIWYLA